VVQAVGQLDDDHADVIDHRQEHLAEVLRLALSLDWNGIALIFVTPSTTCATSEPNSSSMRSIVVSVSSTTSWSRPAAMATASNFMSARKSATARGWMRYGSPEWRTWPRCSKAENTYARLSSSPSGSGL